MARPSRQDAYIANPEVFIKLMGSIDSFIQQNHENVKKVDDWMFDKENEFLFEYF